MGAYDQADSPKVFEMGKTPANDPGKSMITGSSPSVPDKVFRPGDAPNRPVGPPGPAEKRDTSIPGAPGTAPNGDPSKGSEAGTIGALTTAAQANKQSAKEAEVEQARKLELEKLAESKEYYVPLGHSSGGKSGSGSTVAIAIIVLVVAAVVGALFAFNVIKI